MNNKKEIFDKYAYNNSNNNYNFAKTKCKFKSNFINSIKNKIKTKKKNLKDILKFEFEENLVSNIKDNGNLNNNKNINNIDIKFSINKNKENNNKNYYSLKRIYNPKYVHKEDYIKFRINSKKDCLRFIERSIDIKEKIHNSNDIKKASNKLYFNDSNFFNYNEYFKKSNKYISDYIKNKRSKSNIKHNSNILCFNNIYNNESNIQMNNSIKNINKCNNYNIFINTEFSQFDKELDLLCNNHYKNTKDDNILTNKLYNTVNNYFKTKCSNNYNYNKNLNQELSEYYNDPFINYDIDEEDNEIDEYTVKKLLKNIHDNYKFYELPNLNVLHNQQKNYSKNMLYKFTRESTLAFLTSKARLNNYFNKIHAGKKIKELNEKTNNLNKQKNKENLTTNKNNNLKSNKSVTNLLCTLNNNSKNYKDKLNKYYSLEDFKYNLPITAINYYYAIKESLNQTDNKYLLKNLSKHRNKAIKSINKKANINT